MQGISPFLTWTKSVHKANAELEIAKSGYHIKEDKLHAHFVPRLSPALKISYDASNTHPNLDKITDLDLWIEWVHLLNVKLENKQVEWLKITVDSSQVAPKSCGILCNSSVINTMTSSSTLTSLNTPAAMPSANASMGTLKLTQAEHDLLKAHCGCFWCQIFYVGHVTPNCTLGHYEHSSPEACKNITLANALKAKAAFKKKQSTIMVATVFGGDSDNSEVVLGNDEIDEYVSYDLSLPNHLWWTCCIDAPATCAPTPIWALIDHGSTPVLISSDFANMMCLPWCKLFKTFLVSGAFVERKTQTISKI